MNILTAAIVKHMNVDKSYVYQRYIIPDGASPESVANALYGDPEKYWTILLINGIVDPFTGWPMDQTVLENWVAAKHGSPNAILYFTNVETGRQYDSVMEAEFREMIANDEPLPMLVHPVTALEHEGNLNQEKSEIVVITRRYINQFVDMFNKSIEGKE